jgi:hypothetical protein
VAASTSEHVSAVVRGKRRQIGTPVEISASKRSISSLFPEWPGERSLVNLDAGLIRIDDVSSWTAQVYGIGEIGDVFDATPETVTVDLVGSPVRAFGGCSGVLEGEIKALFFRYKSMGNYDYIADVLIGPRRPVQPENRDSRISRSPSTVSHPGDSGALWFYDPPRRSEEYQGNGGVERGARARRLRPIAMQWGGERLALPDGTKTAYALATFVSTVCRELDVEIVRDWCVGYSEYWGKIAHFAVGWKGCDLVAGKLGELMKVNQNNIGFDNDVLSQGSEFTVGRQGFVPLADVPDYVYVTAAKYVRARKYEGQQHFADIDIVPPGHSQSILDACLSDPSRVSATYWRDCFKAFKDLGCGPDEGTLPFRVWQIWDDMVGYLRAGKPDMERFVAAAGIMAHYVADASMPFHCSWLHHGRPPMKQTERGLYPCAHDSDEYKEYSNSREAKIHSIYDEGIMEVETLAALASIDQNLPQPDDIADDITSGYEAAIAVLTMMGDLRRNLSAEDIIKIDDPSLGPKARARKLWANKKIQRAAIASLTASVALLARLWASAWKIGKGEVVAKGRFKAFTEEKLEAIYKDPEFLPAMNLEQMVGKFEPPVETPRRRTKSRNSEKQKVRSGNHSGTKHPKPSA